MNGTASSYEWAYLRAGLLAVAVMLVAAVVGWRVDQAVHEVPTALERMTICLRYEKDVTIQTSVDPVARSADGGALRTVIETNAVTISIGSSPEAAGRVMSAYRTVAPELGRRLELRGRTVYLWERPPSPLVLVPSTALADSLSDTGRVLHALIPSE